MSKWRKKPVVVVEAMQYTGTRSSIQRICDWANAGQPPLEDPWVDYVYGSDGEPHEVLCHTLEGEMRVLKGDYVIRGVKGEFYLCRPDIFAATYEPVEDGPVLFN